LREDFPRPIKRCDRFASLVSVLSQVGNAWHDKRVILPTSCGEEWQNGATARKRRTIRGQAISGDGERALASRREFRSSEARQQLFELAIRYELMAEHVDARPTADRSHRQSQSDDAAAIRLREMPASLSAGCERMTEVCFIFLQQLYSLGVVA
jgi:hypothetical protein